MIKFEKKEDILEPDIQDDPSILETIEAVDKPRTNFFLKLVSGDYGLALTYWVFCVGGGVIFRIIFSSITSINALTLVLIVYILYTIAVMLGVWNAADRYKGSKFWAVLAKILVILGLFPLLSMVITFLSVI